MVLPKNINFIYSQNQEPANLVVPKEHDNSPNDIMQHDSHHSFTCKPTATVLHDDSFDTNSIPESQIGLDLDLSFLMIKN